MVKYKFYLQLDDGKKGNYENFLDELAKKESQGSHDYHAIGYANYFGRYQIGEDTIHDTGYYTNNKITKYSKNGSSAFKWDGKWESPKHLSIKSLNEFVAYKDSCPKDNGGVINPLVKKGNSFVYDTTQFDKEKLPKAKLVQEDVIRIVHQKKWWAVWELFTTPAERTQFNNIKSDSERKNIMIEKLKIGKSFSYEGKNYTITTSGLIAGAHLVGQGAVRKFIVDGEIYKDGNGTPITKYIGELGGFNMTNLFNYTRINERPDYSPIKDGDITSTVKVNTNEASSSTTTTIKKPVAQKKVEKNASGEITIKDYRKGQYKLHVPDYLDENGKPITIDNTGNVIVKPIEPIDTTAKVVVNGAILKCTHGSITSILKIASEKNIILNGEPLAITTETEPIKNIQNFGMCKSEKNPDVQKVIADSKGAVRVYACTPKSIGTWTNDIPFFMAGEKVVSDKSTCKCTWSGEISIEKSQEGQEFFTYGIMGSEETQKKEEQKEDSKKNEAEKTKTQENNAISNTINVTLDNTNGQYLLEVQGDSKEKIVQRHLKTIGFNLNHKDCKECDAYGPKAEANKYKCNKNYKCIDGNLGVKSASALIIFQSKCNPTNSGAQKTGEPNIITGLSDDITLESLKKYTKIKMTEGKETRGIVNLSKEDLIKDWKPMKYETITNEILPKELTVLLPKKALASPSLAVAWSQVIQGALDAKNLIVNNLNFSGPISGFRSYPSQVKTYFEFDMDATYAAKPYFDFPNKIAEEYKLYKKNPTTYDFIGKTKNGCVLSGKGKSNHGKCRAIDLVAGNKENYILKDTECPNELKWLNDNIGKYGFSGYVSLLGTSSNPLKDYNPKNGFYHVEVWHWNYLESYSTYETSKGIKYTALDCFIKENREKLIK